jgi:dimethylargininase
MGQDWSKRKRSRALVRHISPNFTNAIAYYFGSGPTDVAKSQIAHDEYVQALREHGVDVHILPGIENHPDCCFVEDAAIIVEDKVVVPHMGHESREGEQKEVKQYLSSHLQVIIPPNGARMDGGDVMFFDDRLLVGLSSRTNKAGTEFLRGVASTLGFGIMEFEIPESTLHLSTVCSSPRPGTILAAEGHLKPEQFKPLVDEGFELLWVPNEEAYAANTIGFENDRVLISDNYPQTRALLEDVGFEVTTIDMEHIRAADGSLTCLSLFYE